MDEEPESPFKVGDRVTFTPDAHAVGWFQHSWEKFRLKPGDAGTVTRIADGRYIYVDDERGGYHWQCFSPAT
ncbi:MAG: hypothetical protein ABSD20_10685 [Terriglobales bacterium]|jgi:hypothetical protein